MGDGLPFGSVLYFGDGTRFCEVEEIPEFIETIAHMPVIEQTLVPDVSIGFTGRIEIPRNMRRLLLGWRARGPVRYRMLRKALRMLPIKGVAV